MYLLYLVFFFLCLRPVIQGCFNLRVFQTKESKRGVRQNERQKQRKKRKQKRFCCMFYAPVVELFFTDCLLHYSQYQGTAREHTHTHAHTYNHIHTQFLLSKLSSATIYCQVLCTAVLVLYKSCYCCSRNGINTKSSL